MSQLRELLERELAKAEMHLEHCLVLVKAKTEREMLDAGVDALTADTMARMPWLRPSKRHVASTKRAIGKLQKRLEGLAAFEARQKAEVA